MIEEVGVYQIEENSSFGTYHVIDVPVAEPAEWTLLSTPWTYPVTAVHMGVKSIGNNNSFFRVNIALTRLVQMSQDFWGEFHETGHVHVWNVHVTCFLEFQKIINPDLFEPIALEQY